MKKLSAVTILLLAGFSAVHAQELKTKPAYDNISTEKLIKQATMPLPVAKYALPENKTYTTPHKLVFSSGLGIDMRTQTVRRCLPANLFTRPGFPAFGFPANSLNMGKITF